MLVRFACLAVVQAFAALRLLPMADRERDVEILAPRHQVAILRRQLGDQRPRLRPADLWFLAALLVPLSRGALRRLHLLVSRTPSCGGTVTWSNVATPARADTGGPGDPAPLPRFAASCCVWLPRTPRGLAMDIIETVTLTGQRQYILATIHHAGRRVRTLGVTAHPTHAWVMQAVRNLLMDL